MGMAHRAPMTSDLKYEVLDSCARWLRDRWLRMPSHKHRNDLNDICRSIDAAIRDVASKQDLEIYHDPQDGRVGKIADIGEYFQDALWAVIKQNEDDGPNHFCVCYIYDTARYNQYRESLQKRPGAPVKPTTPANSGKLGTIGEAIMAKAALPQITPPTPPVAAAPTTPPPTPAPIPRPAAVTPQQQSGTTTKRPISTPVPKPAITQAKLPEPCMPAPSEVETMLITYFSVAENRTMYEEFDKETALARMSELVRGEDPKARSGTARLYKQVKVKITVAIES